MSRYTADTFVGPVQVKVTLAVVGNGKAPLQTAVGKPSTGAADGPGVDVAVAVGVAGVDVEVAGTVVDVLVEAMVVAVSV
jgi:hypothetical protein